MAWSSALLRGYPGSVYRIVEAFDVAFDEVFPPDTFKIEPPPGWEPPPTRERL